MRDKLNLTTALAMPGLFYIKIIVCIGRNRKIV